MKKRVCDRCGKEMPDLIDLTNPDVNPHDILCLGFKTKTGRTMNESYNLCQDCMDKVDELLSTK